MILLKNSLLKVRNILRRGDPVQASDKLYKALEECIKLLIKKEMGI